MRGLANFYRCAALALVALTTLPFTAPLAACPLADLVSRVGIETGHTHRRSPADLQRAALNQTLPTARATTRPEADAAARRQLSVRHAPALGRGLASTGDDRGPRPATPPLIALRI